MSAWRRAYCSGMPQFVHRSRIAAPAGDVFDWHARPGAFERLNPPWDPAVVVARHGGIDDGGEVVLRVKAGPLRRTWVARHRDFVAGRRFVDEQVRGPFARWVHTHEVTPDGPEACWLEDRVDYALPMRRIGHALMGERVRRTLEAVFVHRHRVTAADVVAHRRAGGQRWHVGVSGSSGFVGRALVPFLTTGGHRVMPIRRGRHGLDTAGLGGCDAVVHLAGENLATGRWTTAKKARILDSRVNVTRKLCEALAASPQPPRVLVCASAVGYYGDRGDEELDESSSRGQGFLADVCGQWEAATQAAEAAGTRVVHLRIGVVLSPEGGALAKMLPVFRLGGGGVIGDGGQYWPWIARDDVIGAIHHAMVTATLAGPVNVVAPEHATNRRFTRSLGTAMGRPVLLPMPAGLARAAFGQMADECLLNSAKVSPARLVSSGYEFRYPTLADTFTSLLGQGGSR